MIRFRFFAFAILFAFSLGGAANFTSTHGKLSVSGGKILDKNNNEIVLRGMSLYWYNGPWGGGQPGNQFYNSGIVSSLADNWSANVIRAAIGDKSVDMAKNMMDWANSAGIYVIIDNHSHNAHNETSAVQSFFQQVSAYASQKNYTHVIYEIYNEPTCNDGSNNSNCTTTTWAQIKNFAQSVINTIRANDADGLIIVGTPYYSSNIAAPRADPLTGNYAKNVLYALHFYAGTSGHSNYRASLEAAYCADFPVFVSEWGTSEASGGGSTNTSNSNTWLSLLEAAKVSHANWSLSNANESSAALTGTSVNASGGTTASGTYVRNILKLNSGSSLSQVGLTAKTIDCSSPEPTGPDGRIPFLSNGSVANFASKSGADSVNTAWGAALVNTSPTFTADYTFTGIQEPGTYLLKFYVGSTANGTVSWSGNGISSGEAQIASTGALSTYGYTEEQLLTVTETPETPLHLSFNMPSANSLYAIYVYTYAAKNCADSAKYGIGGVEIDGDGECVYPSVPIKKLAAGGKQWNFDAAAGVFIFEETGGSLAIYNLRGERKALFPASGRVSLKGLPAGAYLAIYKNGSQFSRKTIFLK